jgi:hypothetical protein
MGCFSTTSRATPAELELTGGVEVDDVAGFTPQAGHVYEVVYALGPTKPELRLFEVIREDGGRVTRQPLPFDLGAKSC